jgi:hypothetical protein
MSEQTVFSVHHSCGHDRRHDLSAKPEVERAGFARLLAWTPCDDCSLPASSPEQAETDDAGDTPSHRLCSGR